MNRREKDTTDSLWDYLKEAGRRLFSLRNSFSPASDKRMSEAEKAQLADFYIRARKALLGDTPDETVSQSKDFP
jgi:hypothetical protein